MSGIRTLFAFVVMMALLTLPVKLMASPEQSANPGSLSAFDDAEYYKKAANEKKAKIVKGKLVFDSEAKAVRFVERESAQLDIPFTAITSMLYERTAKPRYALGLLVAWPLLFTKSKKHFLTIQYKGSDGQGQFALIRLDKKNYQEALAAAEAKTSIKVERTQEK